MSFFRNRCNCRCRRRDEDDVRGIQRIALRGPGCISGTGRCEGVLGARNRCLEAAEEFCEEVFGDRNRCCSNVLGTGSFRCSNRDVLGIRDRRFRCGNQSVMGIRGRDCGQVFGTGGGLQCNDVEGTGGRNRCRCSCWNLKTPLTVPR